MSKLIKGGIPIKHRSNLVQFLTPLHCFILKCLRLVNSTNLDHVKVFVYMNLAPGCVAWYLFDSTSKNATTLITFCIFYPLGLSCSFLTSHLNNVPTPSISTLTWLVAKKFQSIWQLVGKEEHVVRFRYRKTKY